MSDDSSLNDNLPEQILELFDRLKRILSEIENANRTSPNNEFLATSHKYQIAKDLKFLRNICAKGSRVQDFIISLPECIELIICLISPNNEMLGKFPETDGKDIERFLWQFIANLCVQNDNTQMIIFQQIGQLIIESCLQKENINEFTDIKLMILYNIFKGGTVAKFTDETALLLITDIWMNLLSEQNSCNLVFLHLFFEYFLTEYQWGVKTYAKLSTEKRIGVLKYILIYVQNNSPNGMIKTLFLDFISKEFKMKSDCILKTVSSYVDQIYPTEVLALLKVIASASGSDLYVDMYAKDQSLFLNVGGMLKLINENCKASTNSKNIFTPMQTLEEVAPNSKMSSDFEMEISFELRTLLVRTLANLTYKNRKNQDYARDMNFILAILDCTQIDARNPLMKEWSIVAIRNLCDGCFENQEIISKLCKVGDAPNDLLSEINVQMGSLRIQPNK